MNVSKVLAKKIVERRKFELRLTQEDLAKKAGISRSYVAQLEGGDINIRQPVVAALGKALNLSPNWGELLGVPTDRAVSFSNGETIMPSGEVLAAGTSLPVVKGVSLNSNLELMSSWLPDGEEEDIPEVLEDIRDGAVPAEFPDGAVIKHLGEPGNPELTPYEWRILSATRQLHPDYRGPALAILEGLAKVPDKD